MKNILNGKKNTNLLLFGKKLGCGFFWAQSGVGLFQMLPEKNVQIIKKKVMKKRVIVEMLKVPRALYFSVPLWVE